MTRALIHARHYANRTPAGEPSAARAKRSLDYYTYGARDQKPHRLPRGNWFGPESMASYDEVVAWAEDCAGRYAATYILTLSISDGAAHPEDFIRVMTATAAGVFEDWRLIQHDEAGHPHAHVVAFRHRALDRHAFGRWRRRARRLLSGRDVICLAYQAAYPDEESWSQPVQV